MAEPLPILRQMSALSDMTRGRILQLLAQHELGVAELCDVLQMPQSTVSRHLKILNDHGWTVSRRSGTARLYRLAEDQLAPAARQLWEVTTAELAPTPTCRQDQLRLARLLSERTRDRKSFFARAAGQWDRLREELYGRSFITHALLPLLPEGLTVADLGCGTGNVASQLAPYVRKVIGIDQSEAMLRAAGHRMQEMHLDGRVELHQADLEQLPLRTGQCDAALLLLVLSYADEPTRQLAEAARVLKPGGRLVVVDLMRHDRDDFRRQMGQVWPGFEERQLADWFRAAEMKRPHVAPLPPEPEATGPALLLATAAKA